MATPRAAKRVPKSRALAGLIVEQSYLGTR
jgi:hypothetical protein